MMRRVLPLLAFLALFIPGNALAGPIGNIADAVSGGVLASGNYTFPELAYFLKNQILILIDVVGVFFLVRSGLRLINSQDEDKLNKSKRTIAATLVGVMFAHLSDRFVNAFIFPGGSSQEAAIFAGAQILAVEVGGIIDWVLTLVAVLGILMIVLSAIRAIASFGKEDGQKQLKETVFGTATGIGFLIVSSAIKMTLGLVPDDNNASIPGSPDATPIIQRVIEIVVTLMSFLALVAFVVVAYAAFLMIFNMGNEDQFKKGKDLIIRAIIGLVIVLFANVIGLFVLELF